MRVILASQPVSGLANGNMKLAAADAAPSQNDKFKECLLIIQIDVN
jgi:hypothetical protein